MSGSRRRAAPAVPAIHDRLDALQQLADLLDRRVADTLVADARGVLDRAGSRLRLSGEHTVVALAGSTGSGKSSLFNALTELELSGVGVRRPTTSEAHACVWGADGAGPLLDRLEVPNRHRIDRETALDGDDLSYLRGLVLLDLPDHDSTSATHRRTVERLVELVDVIVWVVDPQKYADAALHERYLRRFAGHGSVTVVVLNAIDKLSPEDADACVADLRRLLVEDGFSDATVVATSARTGEGVGDLRALIADAVRRREAAVARLQADITRVVVPLAEAVGPGAADTVGRRERAALRSALGRAAGVPAVTEAVRRSYLRSGAGHTGWPASRWLRHLRPDPLRKLHLGKDQNAASGTDTARLPGRTSLGPPTAVARAGVDDAVRDAVEIVAGELPPRWAELVRAQAATAALQATDALDVAVATTDLEVSRTPMWWRAWDLVQLLVMLVAVVGAAWLAILAGLSYLRVSTSSGPDVGPVALPTLMLVGGVVAGLLLAALGRVLLRVGARRRAARAQERLEQAVGVVAEREIVIPVQEEAIRHRRARELVGRLSATGG